MLRFLDLTALYIGVSPLSLRAVVQAFLSKSILMISSFPLVMATCSGVLLLRFAALKLTSTPLQSKYCTCKQ